MLKPANRSRAMASEITCPKCGARTTVNYAELAEWGASSARHLAKLLFEAEHEDHAHHRFKDLGKFVKCSGCSKELRVGPRSE